MKLNLGLIIIAYLISRKQVKPQNSAYETFLPKLRLSISTLFQIQRSSSEDSLNLNIARQLGKLQPKVSNDVPFPCPVDNTRSKDRPSSVHLLRPGDIDVIGAIGDSLTAGNGVVATNLFQVAIQNRGLSFAGGGQGTWREYVTLPNIFKEFNPQLYGYSSSDSSINQNASRFTIAEAFAVSKDMISFTNELIRRMKEDPRVNFETDWKLITVVFGDNDFCEHMCYLKNPEDILENHRKDLTEILRLLRDNLPRTIVNMGPPPHVRLLRDVTTENRPPLCFFTGNLLCPCMFDRQFRNQQKRFDEVMTRWQMLDAEIADQPEFDRDDFTIVFQPFIVNYTFHNTSDGLTDYSSLSEDCFHPSQKEYAKIAVSMWNTLLEPVGAKSTNASDLFNFKCPTSEFPYIFTRRNSIAH